MDLIVCALGALKITELVKDVIPWRLQSWVKSLISVWAAGTFAGLVAHGFRAWLVLTVAAAGLSSALHAVSRFFMAMGDEARQKVMLRIANPRREVR
jgi:hypothetical protein